MSHSNKIIIIIKSGQKVKIPKGIRLKWGADKTTFDVMCRAIKYIKLSPDEVSEAKVMVKLSKPVQIIWCDKKKEVTFFSFYLTRNIIIDETDKELVESHKDKPWVLKYVMPWLIPFYRE